jgi:hypothetical protein
MAAYVKVSATDCSVKVCISDRAYSVMYGHVSVKCNSKCKCVCGVARLDKDKSLACKCKCVACGHVSGSECDACKCKCVWCVARLDKDNSLSVSWDEWRNFFQLHSSAELDQIVKYWRKSLVSTSTLIFSYFHLRLLFHYLRSLP